MALTNTLTVATNERDTTQWSPASDTHFAFIPERLGQAGRRLEHFPVSVLFVSSAVSEGGRTTSEAVYEPDFGTFRQDDGVGAMVYRNKYGENCLLVMAYDNRTAEYRGTKIVGGTVVGTATGHGWNEFFANLGELGITPEESRRVIDVDRPWNRRVLTTSD